MATYTQVTWNGATFEPMDHDDYRAARGYIAEFVAFHGTEAGMRSKRTAPDVWTITGNGNTLVIRIRQD